MVLLRSALQLASLPYHNHQYGAQMIVFVSYVPRQRRFSAHRAGLAEVHASSLSELRAKLAAVRPEQKITMHLSRAARVEVARRRGTPLPGGWT